MTYQNLGYWVAQANDLSTGSHPTGWTSGQRWSETAGEWMTMYNAAYTSAHDTSTGSHPTGWVSGQLWSTTAGQWIPMYNAEFANARDNSGGQTSSGLGAQHPSGYTTGQFWSSTAEQWNTMWGTEWRAARDPQGFAWSYPGQGANAVYWSQSASYWRGQADYYWGPSRVWNNGSTWESMYNAYVGYYNDMLSQKNTWESRANQAWGPSRSWPNGESWESAYNRVLPAGSGQTPIMYQASGAVSNNNNWMNVCAVNLDRPGFWDVTVRGSGSQGDRAPGQSHQLLIGGTVVDGGDADASGDCSGHWTIGAYWRGVTGPVTATFQGYPGVGDGGNSISATIYAVFVPTQSYPH